MEGLQGGTWRKRFASRARLVESWGTWVRYNSTGLGSTEGFPVGVMVLEASCSILTVMTMELRGSAKILAREH